MLRSDAIAAPRDRTQPLHGPLRLGILLAVGLSSVGAAAFERPTARAVRVDVAPVVDGALDDDVWADAPLMSPLRQKDPIEGAEPTERTEVRILHDGTTLYFGIRCFDSEPDRLIAQQMRRDASLQSDDRVSLMLGPFNDRRNGFLISTNPNGARLDGISEDNQFLREEWDGIWMARSRIDAEGWTTEIAIPFRTLPFDPEKDRWDLNVLRSIRRRNEIAQWASPQLNTRFIDLARSGELLGLVDLEQGVGLDVVPGASLGIRERADGRMEDIELEPSLDVFQRLGAALTGAITVNPDFSDAPVDARQVNLSRFALFFPETRDFFLQDAGIFDFGDLFEANGTPFFSRRIGIGPDGQVVDIHAGAKLTGRVGRFGIGLLNVQTEAFDGIRSKNLSVARPKVAFGSSSYVGALVTHGDPGSNGSNSVFGADFLLRTSEALGDQILELFGWGLKSHTPGLDDADHAMGFRLAWPNDRWNGRAIYTEFGEDYNPALGFANRTGIREYRANLRRRFRPEGSWVRFTDHFIEGRITTDRDDSLESINVNGRILDVFNQAGDFISFRAEGRTEVLNADFEIFPGIVVPKDRYGFGRGTIALGTDDSRPVSVEVTYGIGSFFSGDIRALLSTIELRPSPHLFTSVVFEQNQIRLPEGDFTTRVVRFTFNVSFTPDISWDNLIQWDDVSDSLGWNSRLRWIVEPGRELVFVLNQGMSTEGRAFQRIQTELRFNVSWTFRF